MFNNIKKYYFWPGLEKDISQFVKRCEKCQRHKYSIPVKEAMTITSTAHAAFEKIYLDIVGPLSIDNNSYNYILTLQCELTKYVEVYPLITKTSNEVAKSFVENFILRYGIPNVIATDRGTEFMSATFKEVCTLLNIKKLNSTAYHHQSLGALENSHKHLGAFLRIQAESHPNTWSNWLPFWSFSHNTAVHSETKYTPYELVFSKICKLPSKLTNEVEPLYNHEDYPLELKFRLQTAVKEARENLLKGKVERKIQYDKKVNPIKYKPNDQILLKNEVGKKLEKLYSGPYTVVQDLETNVEIIIEGKNELVHKNRTKMFYS